MVLQCIKRAVKVLLVFFSQCLQPRQCGFVVFVFFASFSQTHWDYFAEKEKEGTK